MKKEKWYVAGLNFTCTRCGNCCSGAPGYVWVNQDEITRISESLGRTDGSLDKDHIRRVGRSYSLTEKKNGDCIFLTRDEGKTGCAIHTVRPRQCQTWPFWSENLRSADAWNEAHVKCPGMNTGQHHDFVQIEFARTHREA